MKTISLKLVGTKPLMVHNPRVVDPFDKYKKLLQPLTSKRTKTDDDLLEICRLQFLASLYYRNGEYVLPQSHVEGSFQAAAKERKLGKKFERSFGLYGDGVAKKAGINASLMRQYAMGIHEPSKKRKQQILDCLHGISKELQAVVI